MLETMQVCPLERMVVSIHTRTVCHGVNGGISIHMF